MLMTDFDFFPSQISVPPQISVTQDISAAQAAIRTNSFADIIHSSELFWLTYCIEASKIPGEHNDGFFVSLNERTVKISGEEHLILKIQRVLEEIRSFYIKGLEEKKDFSILAVPIADKMFLKEPADPLVLPNWLTEEKLKVCCYWFKKRIAPCMKEIAKSVGATASIDKISQEVLMVDPLVINTKTVRRFRIEWSKNKLPVYPIEPISIPSRKLLPSEAHEMLEKQILCDLKLVARDGSMNAHSMLLFLKGGPLMKTMLTGGMKEALEKVVTFSDFSLKTIKSFLDFVYLGESGLLPEKIQEHGIDLFELFVFAHLHDFTPFLDCCTNLISLFARPDDIPQIIALATTYNNPHLKALAEHLASSSGVTTSLTKEIMPS